VSEERSGYDPPTRDEDPRRQSPPVCCHEGCNRPAAVRGNHPHCGVHWAGCEAYSVMMDAWAAWTEREASS
jgi:hypothetical protein